MIASRIKDQTQLVLTEKQDLILPLHAITETFGILAVRGAGKSNTAAVMAEEMFRLGLPFVVVDPVGAWWGLRSSADGKSSGLPITIFGGDHGDVPLERGGGALVADLVVERRVSCVLDLSGFASEAAKKQFLLDFAQRLYQRNRQPLHLFLEEADDYIPQRPMRDEALLLRAWENIVRRGRGRGLGMTLITQRSAAINKNVLTQVGTLIAMRTTGPQDRAAIEEWLKYHGQGREILESLPSLGDGEAWIWSPRFLDLTKRLRFRRRRTYDTGRTPTMADASKPGATLADVDLDAVRVAMAETIERAKADDPKELRREIAALKKQLAAAPKPPPERVEVPVFDAKALATLTALQASIVDLVPKVENVGGLIEIATTRAHRSAIVDTRQPKAPRPDRATTSRERPVNSEVGGGLRRMLTALAQRPQGLTHGQIGVRAGLSSRSGTFSTYIARARSAGWITGERGSRLQITDAGLRALGSFDPLPTGSDLANHWINELGGGAARLLRAIVDAYPRSLSHAEAGRLATLSHGSGTFSTYVSRLRSLELIEGRGELRASEELIDD